MSRSFFLRNDEGHLSQLQGLLRKKRKGRQVSLPSGNFEQDALLIGHDLAIHIYSSGKRYIITINPDTGTTYIMEAY